jgi:hypothetical protein
MKTNEKAFQKCIDEVLIYNPTLKDRDRRVGRCYLLWREKYGPPKRCDNKDCRFFREPLEWNRKPPAPIVDHKNGNFRDSRPDNLQFVCPNCASQLYTHGALNIGRVRFSNPESYGLKADPKTNIGEIILLVGDGPMPMSGMQDSPKHSKRPSKSDRVNQDAGASACALASG